MGVSKVDLNGETLIDLTEDTVNPNVLLSGYSAHNAAGEPVDGAVTAVPTTTSLAVTEEGVSALDGSVGKVLNDKINEINGNLSGFVKMLILRGDVPVVTMGGTYSVTIPVNVPGYRILGLGAISNEHYAQSLLGYAISSNNSIVIRYYNGLNRDIGVYYNAVMVTVFCVKA